MPIRRVRVGPQDDLLDQSAQQISCLGPGAVFIQRPRQIRDLAGVYVCDAGMDRDRFCGGQGLQLGRKICPFRLQPIHLGLHRWMIHPFRKGRHDAVDLSQHLGKAAFGIGPRGEAVEPFLLALSLILGNEFCDQVWMQQLVLQPREHARLDIIALDRLAVGAGARVARGCAAVPAVADHDVVRSAAAALQRARKQMARPTTHLGPRRGWVVIAGGENILTDRTLSYLHPLPLCVIDDPQVRHVLGDPRLRRIGPGLTFASLGILYKPLAVPDQFADVELIVEDAGAALPVTRDC